MNLKIFQSTIRFSLRWSIFFIALFMCGCSSHHLIDVRTQFLDRNYLASEQINTPDPLRQCFIGQKVVVKWRLPNCYINDDDLRLEFSVRYGNQQHETIPIFLNRHRGIWTYSLINDAYLEKEGMNAYKVEIYSGEERIAFWKHHVWVEIIDINQDQEEVTVELDNLQ